jgi:large repetitive protein
MMNLAPRHVPWLVLALQAYALVVPSCSAETHRYYYDSLKRLTRATYSDGTTIDYVYDMVGNLLLKTTTLSGAPTNQPPPAVTRPGIANQATNVSTSISLSWSPVLDPNPGDLVVYFVYFGTSPTPPLAYGGRPTNWSPGRLRGLTTYYWQIVARDNHNAQTVGPVWSFTTGNSPPRADFVASPGSGPAPLEVNFTDRSVDLDNAIVSWQWDFDNNGTIDSIIRNPGFTYTRAGDYSVRLTVRDEAGATNTLTKTNCISVLGSNVVDLAVLSLGLEAATSYRNVRLRYVVTNQGVISLSGRWQWQDAIYLSTNAVLDASDKKLTTFYESQVLGAGSVYSRTNLAVLPDAAGPNHYLILKTDSQNEIGERNEGNNVMSIPLKNLLPDLVPSQVMVSTPIAAGAKMTLAYSITNQGQVTIEGEWSDAVYWSTNSTWEAQDVRIGTLAFELSLAPGQGRRQTNTFLMPKINGSGYLIIRTDFSNQIVESDEANNVLLVPLTLAPPPDLAPLRVFLPALAASGQPLTVLSLATNRGPSSAQPEWRDVFYFSSDAVLDASDIECGSFVQTAVVPNYGAYSRSNVLVMPRKPAGTYQLLYRVDAYDAVYETAETNNVLAVPITLTVPDLKPLSLRPLGPVVAGAALDVAILVTNQGNGSVQQAWTDSIRLSTNTVIDPHDPQMGSFSRSITLPPGGSYLLTNSVGIPNVAPGYYQMLLQVDAEDDLYETSETNNTLAVPVVLTAPDLAPVSLLAPASIVIGQQFQLALLVTNRGSGPALPQGNDLFRGWFDQIELVPDSSISNAHRQILATFIRSETVPAGASYVDNQKLDLRVDEPGIYYLVASVDFAGGLYESSEANNSLRVPIRIDSGQKPDLMPLELTAPGTWFIGQSVSVSWTVTNQGLITVKAPLYDYLYLSTNAEFDWFDTSLGLYQYKTNLDSGRSYQATKSVPVPNVQPGSYYLLVVCDPVDVLFETIETNNVTALPVQLTMATGKPDLAVMDVVVPATMFVGRNASVSWTVTNRGNASAYASWNDSFYLSTNATPDMMELLFDSSVWHRTDLAPAGSYRMTNLVRIPEVNPGNYYFVIEVGDADRMAESVMTNNLHATPVQVKAAASPDLRPLSLSAPSLWSPGQKVTISWTVTNQGPGLAEAPWDDSLQLSVDPGLGWDDEFLKSPEYRVDVNPGSSYSVTYDLTVPEILPGDYYLILNIDDFDVLDETQETNNTRTVRVTVRDTDADSDGDGISDSNEVLAGTDPHDPASVFRLMPPQRGSPRGVRVCWSSRSDRRYTLERSTNLMLATPFVVIQSNLAGQTNLTCITDVTATNRGPYFYRVRVNR